MKDASQAVTRTFLVPIALGLVISLGLAFPACKKDEPPPPLPSATEVAAEPAPTLELAALTYRAPGRYVGANHLPLAELLTYVAPNLYGHPTWHDQFYTHAGIGGMLMRHGGYIAIVPLVLALFALVQRRREGRVLCHGVLSFGNLAFLVLLGFGLEPLLLAIVPQFGGLHAKRQVVVYSVSAAVLAGFGLDALLAAEWRRVCIVARAVAIAALALLAACVALDIYCRIAGDAAPQVLRSWQSRSPSGILALYRGVGSAVLLLGLTWATIRFGRHTGPRTWSMCLVALASVDLFAQARLYNPFVPRDWVYPPTDAVTWLRRQPGMFRISGVSPPVDEEHPRLDWYDRRYKGDSLPPNTAMPLRLYDARGRTSLFPRWIREYAERVTGNDDIRVLFDYRADEHRQHMVNLLGARYVLSPTPLAGDQFALVHDAPLRVYENKRAVPHVFVASEVEVVADDAAALRRLATEPPPLDHVLVDRELPPSPASSLATAEITSYEPNEVRVRITTQGGGYLVLSDTWFPGWNAYADGEPRPIARANYLMRCVPLKPTDTEVRFVYEPQAFRTGLFLSLTGLGIAFALAVVCFVARSRREAVQ